MNIVQRGKSPLLDRFVEVALMALAVVADDGFAASASVRFLMPCWRAEVELDPDALVVRVDEAEGVAAEAVHVAVRRAGMPRSLITIVT